MKILLDCRRKLNSGIGRVTEWLINHFSYLKEHEFHYLVTEQSIIDYQLQYNTNSILVNYKPFSVEDFYSVPIEAIYGEFDLIINPQVNASPFHLVPNITIIHDLWFIINVECLPSQNSAKKRFELGKNNLFEKFGKFLNRDNVNQILSKEGQDFWLKNNIEKNVLARYLWSQIAAASIFSTQLVFVHDKVKQDFERLFDRKHNLLTISNGFKKLNIIKEDIESKYFLAVGKLEQRKNILNIINAFELFIVENQVAEFKLIIVGDPGYPDYAQLVLNKISELQNNDINIEFIPSVDQNKLCKLYSNAEALIFPSEYESFGLPILEAMAMGTPVFCTEVGVAKSHVKEFVNLIKSPTPENICNAMLAFLRNKGEYIDKASKAIKIPEDMFNNMNILNQWKETINSFTESD